jgi:hypothetical protein
MRCDDDRLVYISPAARAADIKSHPFTKKHRFMVVLCSVADFATDLLAYAQIFVKRSCEVQRAINFSAWQIDNPPRTDDAYPTHRYGGILGFMWCESFERRWVFRFLYPLFNVINPKQVVCSMVYFGAGSQIVSTSSSPGFLLPIMVAKRGCACECV